MNADEQCEEQIASRLVAWDEALAAGGTPSLADTPNVPLELHGRLGRDLECMKLLHDARPRQRRADDSLTPDGTSDSAEGQTPAMAGLFVEGQPLGRFQLRRELGRGGFGVVFLAHDPILHRDVALKVPRLEGLVTPELRERFQQEARAAAGLDHPNIVPVYEAGEVGPINYIASAYCPGLTLAAWLKERVDPVPFAIAAELTADLADAVQHAHTRGVLHRDLKPSNVMVGYRPSAIGHQPEEDDQPEGKSGSVPIADGRQPVAVKITDFGLAKLLDADASGPFTRTGAVLGTPSYMAPEQAGAEKTGLGPGVDIYALGAILYEVLTGRPPFLGDSDVDTLVQVRTLDPVSPRRLRPTLPRDLETICLKCLHKETRGRYASAGDLADDLRRFLRKEPIRARPLGFLGRTWRWCRRRPAVAGLILALGLVIVGSVVGLASLWLLAEDRARLAERRRDESEESLRRGRRAIDQYFTTISEEELLNVDGLQPLREKLLHEAVRFYQEFLDQHQANPRLQEEVAIAKRRLATIKAHQGRAADSEDDLRKAIERLRPLVREHPDNPAYATELAHLHQSLGTVQSKLGRSDEALASYRESLRLLENLEPTGANDRRVQRLLAVVQQGIGTVLFDQGQTETGVQTLELARQRYELLCREQTDDETWLGLALTQQFLGSALCNLDRLDEAEKQLRDAHSIQQRLTDAKTVRGEVKQQLARTLHRLSVLELRRKNWEAALGYGERAVVMNRQLARDNPRIRNHQVALAECFNIIGCVHREARRPMEAFAFLWQGAEVLRLVVEESPEDPYVRHQLSQHLYNLGLMLTNLSRPVEALRAFEEGVEHARIALEAARQSESRRQTLAKHYYHVSRIHRSLGRHAAAAEAARKRVALYPADRQQLSEACILLAHCVAVVGQGKSSLTAEETAQRQQYADEAMRYLRQAVANGYQDVKRLKEDRQFDPLRERDDFQQLLAGLEKVP